MTVSEESISVKSDPYGITDVFAAHLALALEHSHPDRAARAAYAAVDSYLKSYSFINTSHKGSDKPEWRMVMRQESKTEGRGSVK